jgi:formate dehydrogenase major subunit
VHQIALTWHYGWSGVAVGNSTNDLISLAGDPNVTIHESRGFTCDVRAGRRDGATTRRLAGVRSGWRVAPNEDDPPAEQPKEVGGL